MRIKPSINWLFVFIPVTLALEHGGVPAPYVFFSAALAIVPIASLIVRATEQIATRTGDAVGGLLNATFGNAPELIIAFVALKAGLLDMVRASLIGAILANILLALGVAFLLGGLRYRDQDYNPAAARVYSSMMLIAVVSLAVPSAFSRFFAPEETIRQETLLNVGLASRAAHRLCALPRVHAEDPSGRLCRPRAATVTGKPRAHTGACRGRSASLVGASLLAAWMSEILVGAAEGTGQALGMTQVFIGIVFVAIVGGAAESLSAIVMGRKNRVDMTIGIALGSSIQIALFIAPVLVLASYFIAPQPLELSFGRAEVGALMMAVLIGAVVCGDGRSNWYKGVQLITVYIIIALMFYFLPDISHSG